MQTIAHPFRSLSDDQLLHEVRTLAAREHQALADLIASLAELDARQLYLAQGCGSFFAYCTDCLHFFEHEAYDRMKVARAVRQWPLMLGLIADGSLSVTAARLLAPHLTEANHQDVLRAGAHKRIREVEEQIAALRPKPDVPSTVRKLPNGAAAARNPMPQLDGVVTHTAATPVGTQMQVEQRPSTAQNVHPVVRPTDRPILCPLAPDRYRIQFTIARETRDKLRRVQDLLRHTLPDGDPAVIFDRALTVLLADLEKRKVACVQRPRIPRAANPQSRYIPASIRRDVWTRDGGRCAFIGTEGRCAATGFLEFHHVRPYAEGGRTIASNLELRCRAHNAYEAAMYFGDEAVEEERRT